MYQIYPAVVMQYSPNQKMMIKSSVLMIQTHKGSHPPPIYFAPRGTHHGSHLINHRSASVRISLMSFTGLSLVSTSQLFNTSLGSQLYTAVWDAKTKIQGFRSAFGNCKKGIIFRKEMKIGVSQIEIPQQNLLCFCCFLLRLCQIRGQNLLSFWQLQELSTPQDLQATNNSTKPRYCPDVERTFSLDSVNEKRFSLVADVPVCDQHCPIPLDVSTCL